MHTTLSISGGAHHEKAFIQSIHRRFHSAHSYPQLFSVAQGFGELMAAGRPTTKDKRAHASASRQHLLAGWLCAKATHIISLIIAHTHTRSGRSNAYTTYIHNIHAHTNSSAVISIMQNCVIHLPHPSRCTLSACAGVRASVSQVQLWQICQQIRKYHRKHMQAHVRGGASGTLVHIYIYHSVANKLAYLWNSNVTVTLKARYRTNPWELFWF